MGILKAFNFLNLMTEYILFDKNFISCIIRFMEINKQKKFAAGLSIFSNAVIIILKLIAGFLSGSISIISEAIHSLSDMFASVLTLVNLRNKTYDLISNPTTKEMAFKKLSSFTKKSKIAKVGMIASAGALYTSFIINEVNRKKADKTANERGFLTERDSLKIKNAQENYFVNNHIYNEHIKG